MKREIDITLNDVTLTIAGLHLLPEYSGDPQEFEINTVKYNGTNVTELIDELNDLSYVKGEPSLWEMIEIKCLNKLN